MLDVALHGVSFAYRGGFALRSIDLLFGASTCTAVAGRGSSTLLKLIAGELRPEAGEIVIGARAVTRLGRTRRPLLYATNDLDLPARWSVRHALVAAVRQRTLDRIDRQQEYELAVEKWRLASLTDRRLRTLSSSELTLVRLAAVELRRPGIVVADRLLAGADPATLRWAGDEFFRTLRVIGATVIAAPSSLIELGWADRLVILDDGAVLQAGRPAQVFAAPLHEAAALATGAANIIPISIDGTAVQSPIGEWEVSARPFEGSGIALARPDDFEVARPGEESDLIFNVEEAAFVEGRWMATGILSGGFLLRISLPRTFSLEKGKLLALRYDPSRFPLIKRDIPLLQRSAPTDVVPPMRETR